MDDESGPGQIESVLSWFSPLNTVSDVYVAASRLRYQESQVVVSAPALQVMCHILVGDDFLLPVSSRWFDTPSPPLRMAPQAAPPEAPPAPSPL